MSDAMLWKHRPGRPVVPPRGGPHPPEGQPGSRAALDGVSDGLPSAAASVGRGDRPAARRPRVHVARAWSEDGGRIAG